MENYRRWISYDWFKLAVALLLLIVFILLMLRPPQAISTASADLPGYPQASFNWSYDSASRTLRNPQGETLFSLSADGQSWQPLIPPELEAGLPSGYRLVPVSAGGWEILDTGGRRLYFWDPLNFQWSPEGAAAGPASEGATHSPEAPAEAETTAPPAKAATVTTPSPTETPTTIPSPTEAPPAEAQPTEVPPTEIPLTEAQPTEVSPAKSPTTASPTLETPAIAATTVVTTPVATAAAAGDATPTPEAVQLGPAAGDCPAPSPSRLVVGESARVLTNLNLRSAPEIGANIIKTHPTGTLLQVLQGPVCVPYQNSAYQWWEVEGPGGVTGWSAEAFLNGNGYFLEPAP